MVIARILIIVCVLHKLEASDRTNSADKIRVVKLSQEVIMDAKYKIRQAEGIKQEHSLFLTFEVGFLIGQIREKYKLMMESYRICHNRATGKAWLPTPKIYEYWLIHYYNRMEYIHQLEMDIDKLVHALESMPPGLEAFNPMQFRADGAASDEEQKRIALEEAVKSRQRQEFLLRQLGGARPVPVGGALRKRFLDMWPVRDTWSLENTQSN